MVFFGSTKEELHALIAKIIPYMENVLHLSVKKNWSVFRVDDRGVDFVGYVFKHSGIRLRKGIAKTLRRVSMKIKQRVNKGMLINYHLYCAINSMCGWLKHCDSGGLKLKYVDVIWEHVVAYHDTVIVNNKKEVASMQLLSNAMYDDKPESVTVYPSMVDVVVACVPVNQKDEMTGKTSVKWQCDIERYSTSEYIDKLRIENANLSQQLTDTQVALCDVYEMLA